MKRILILALLFSLPQASWAKNEIIDRSSCEYLEEPAPGDQGSGKTQPNVVGAEIRLGGKTAHICAASARCKFKGTDDYTETQVVCSANGDSRASCPTAAECAAPDGVVRRVRKKPPSQIKPRPEKKNQKQPKPGPKSGSASS